MHIVDTTLQDWELVVPNPRGGDVFRKVIRGAEGGTAMSYDIRIERFGSGDRGYTSIRHRHDFEQLRLAVSGSMDLGFETLEEGDVGYFPANVFYGPQRCDGALILVAQWGDRFITKDESDRAVAELSEHGAFQDGVYHGVDERGRTVNKDPLNAIWEHVFGEPYVPRAPRYRPAIVMTPAAFGWSEPEGAVRRRRLGVFTEHRLAVETVGWIEDGSFAIEAGDHDLRPTLLFTTAGSFAVDETRFGPLSGVWAQPGESGKIHGAAGSELVLVRFPEPSSRLTAAAHPGEVSVGRR